MIAKLERRGVIRRVEQGRGRRASRYQLILAGARGDLRVLSERTVGSSPGTTTGENSDPIDTPREDREVRSEGTDGSGLRGPYGPPISNEEDRSINTAAAPRFEDKAKEPNGDNYHVILAIANEVLRDCQFTSKPEDFPPFVEEVKQQCANHQIDYGRHPDVAANVVHRACSSALMARQFGNAQHRSAR
jgi:hypothetical protein